MSNRTQLEKAIEKYRLNVEEAVNADIDFDDETNVYSVYVEYRCTQSVEYGEKISEYIKNNSLIDNDKLEFIKDDWTIGKRGYIMAKVKFKNN